MVSPSAALLFSSRILSSTYLTRALRVPHSEFVHTGEILFGCFVCCVSLVSFVRSCVLGFLLCFHTPRSRATCSGTFSPLCTHPLPQMSAGSLSFAQTHPRTRHPLLSGFFCSSRGGKSRFRSSLCYLQAPLSRLVAFPVCFSFSLLSFLSRRSGVALRRSFVRCGSLLFCWSYGTTRAVPPLCALSSRLVFSSSRGRVFVALLSRTCAPVSLAVSLVSRALGLCDSPFRVKNSPFSVFSLSFRPVFSLFSVLSRHGSFPFCSLSCSLVLSRILWQWHFHSPSQTRGVFPACVCVWSFLSPCLPFLCPCKGGGSSLAWLSYAPSQPTGKLGGVPRGPNSRGTRPLPYLANSYSNFNVDVYMGPDHKENAGTPIFCVTPSGTRTHHSALRSTLDVAILTLLWFTLTVDSRCIRPSFHRPPSHPLRRRDSASSRALAPAHFELGMSAVPFRSRRLLSHSRQLPAAGLEM